jgi:hypothetical protein
MIGSGELRLAVSLALVLMMHGSQQLEASDHGLMTGNIEECLSDVIEVLV